ncbi:MULTISPECIES: hypothetical protein [Pseudomonas]|uniref:hypothetical protein n=1 Tax=Pseudomonas TaxID=286 RepID=UPI000A6C40DD|nr:MULTISPECIES: hypothetical protein [Pseudomonas]
MSSELEAPTVAVKNGCYIIRTPDSTDELGKEGLVVDFRYKGERGTFHVGDVELKAGGEKAEIAISTSLNYLTDKILRFYYRYDTHGDSQDSKVATHPNVGA